MEEAETGATCLQAKKCKDARSHPKLGGQGGILSQGPQGERGPADTRIWGLWPPGCKNINFC